jgi:hypothetical protein
VDTDRSTSRDAATTAPIPPTGAEGSTGGSAAASRGSTGPATTGAVSGVNRQPGEPSAVGPTPREEELFRRGEQLEQRAKEGICLGC